MTKPPPNAELKSTLLNAALSSKCPHCALSKFLLLWGVEHKDLAVSDSDIVGAICDVLGDILVTQPHKRDVGVLSLRAFLQLGENITDIIAGEYKTDLIDVLRAKKEGGLH